jgi:hypothetical protein
MLSAQTLPGKVSQFQHITKLIDERATLGKTEKEKKQERKKGRLTERRGHPYTYTMPELRQFCIWATQQPFA